MGVYHLMGLGRSPGAVTGPLSYLAFRYKRWEESDKEFFALSGEASHRNAGKKVGDVQAIVFFSTEEILSGNLLCSDYIENERGKTRGRPVQGCKKDVKSVVTRQLKKVWPEISGNRKQGTVFWCSVDRRNVMDVYEKVITVVEALAMVGGQGKEMWANLTGGNNVTNLALQLAATLSGKISRLYYVQAQSEEAEKCLYYTAEDGYWVDVPVMPLGFDRVHKCVLAILENDGEVSPKDLYGRLMSQHYDVATDVQSALDLENRYLTSLCKQGLISIVDSGYVVGPRWPLVKPYIDALVRARDCELTLEQLSQRENWITREEIDIR